MASREAIVTKHSRVPQMARQLFIYKISRGNSETYNSKSRRANE